MCCLTVLNLRMDLSAHFNINKLPGFSKLGLSKSCRAVYPCV